MLVPFVLCFLTLVYPSTSDPVLEIELSGNKAPPKELIAWQSATEDYANNAYFSFQYKNKSDFYQDFEYIQMDEENVYFMQSFLKNETISTIRQYHDSNCTYGIPNIENNLQVLMDLSSQVVNVDVWLWNSMGAIISLGIPEDNPLEFGNNDNMFKGGKNAIQKPAFFDEGQFGTLIYGLESTLDRFFPSITGLYQYSWLFQRTSKWFCAKFLKDRKAEIFLPPTSLEEAGSITPGTKDYLDGTFKRNNSAVTNCTAGKGKQSLEVTTFGNTSINLISDLTKLGLQNISQPVKGLSLTCLPWNETINENNAAKAFDFLQNWVTFYPPNLPDDFNLTDSVDFFLNQTRALGAVCSNFKNKLGEPLFPYTSCPVEFVGNITNIFELSYTILAAPGENLFLYDAPDPNSLYAAKRFFLAACEIDGATYQEAVIQDFNQIPCETCTNGTASFDGYECVPCDAGFYQDEAGQSQCKACALGTYQDQKGQDTCLFCPPGNITGGGIVCHEEDCQAGQFYNQTNRSCDVCSSGTYQDESHQTTCKDCTAPKRIGNLTFCQCLPGYGSSDGTAEECGICDKGFYQDETGLDSCKQCNIPNQTTLAVGSNSSADCLCNKGYGLDSLNESCQKCLPGFNQSDVRNLSCAPCPLGKYQDKAEQEFCSLCYGGTYEDEVGQTACKICKIGTYGAEFNSLFTTFWISRIFNYSSGHTSCTKCSAGTYQNQRGETQCKFCQLGTSQRNFGAYNCPQCEKGFYANSTGLTSCFDCLPGKYQDEIAQTACIMCDLGENSSTVAAPVPCEKCTFGRYANEKGSTECKQCQPGTYADNRGSSSCKDCPSGTYGPLHELSLCLESPRWRIIPNEKATSLPSGQSGRCDAGTSAPYTGLSRCYKCNRGTYRISAEDLGCNGCDTGTYADTMGLTMCKACPRDQVQPRSGAVYCECNPGKYTIRDGVCGNCGDQDYQDEIGQAKCKTCQPFEMPLPNHRACVSVVEEITRTCLLVFWVPECYKDGVHPITIALWLVILFFAYHFSKFAGKNFWNFIWT